jgi:hypothetical protein
MGRPEANEGGVMFSHTVIRTALGAVLATMLLAPAALADGSASDRQVGLDPAIVTAIHNRVGATAEQGTLDPAIVRATPIPLDPAIQAALNEHRAATPTRPDDRLGTRGPGSLPQPSRVGTSGGFDWNNVGFGAAAALAALLLALGSAIAMRHARTRVTNA